MWPENHYYVHYFVKDLIEGNSSDVIWIWNTRSSKFMKIEGFLSPSSSKIPIQFFQSYLIVHSFKLINCILERNWKEIFINYKSEVQLFPIIWCEKPTLFHHIKTTNFELKWVIVISSLETRHNWNEDMFLHFPIKLTNEMGGMWNRRKVRSRGSVLFHTVAQVLTRIPEWQFELLRRVQGVW